MYIDYKLLGKVRPTVEGDWDIKKEYKLLSIVFDADSNKSYISKKDVPIGISILNKEYWGRFSNNRIDSDSIIILSHKNGLGQINSYTLEEAIATISDDDKRIGMFISFYEKPISADDDYRWNMYQFNSNNVEDWNNVNYWSSIYYIKTKFFGLQETEEALYGVRINPDIGDYAFVGMTLKDAVIYRCRTKNVWTRTEEPAIDYITVMLKGNITVGSNGNWFENGVDTGIKAQGPKGDKGDSIKGDKGDTPVMRLDKPSGYVQYGYDGIHWENLIPLTEFVINNNPDDEDIIADDNDKLKFADKSYDAAQFSGLGRKYLRKNIQQGKNILTQDMINQENTIYIIQYDYDLNGAEITIPTNCVLQFEGGSLKNGIINSDDCIIKSSKYKIFYNITGKIKSNINVYSIWFGDKTSDVNKICNIFENSKVFIYNKLKFDETININKPNISIEWHGDCTLDDDNIFMIYQPGNGKLNCFGAVVYVKETQTNNVIVLRGQLSESPHTGDHNIIDFPDVRYILDQNTPPLPNCIGLFIEMNKNFSSGYLYNKTINFNARSINTAVAIGFQNINTNLANNVYNIVSWWCNNTLRYIKNEVYTDFMDNGSTYNLMVEPNRQFEKIILIDNYVKNSTSIGECEYNLWIYDTQIIPIENKNKLIDISAKSTYNDMLYISNTIGDFFNQDIGQSRLLLSSKGAMIPFANELQIISNYQLTRNYIIKGIEEADDKKTVLQKFIFNILSLKTGQNIYFILPFSTQIEDLSTSYDRIYKKEIVKIISKLFLNDSEEFVGDKKMSGILKVLFIAQDSARSYDRVIFSFETIYNKVQFQIGMKLKPTNIITYENIDIREISNYTYISAITDNNYKESYNYKGKFNFNNIPTWFNGEKYVNSNGLDINIKNTGTFAEKPIASTGIPNGFAYFCTDKQTTEGQANGIMIYHKGSDVWVDALGRTIS